MFESCLNIANAKSLFEAILPEQEDLKTRRAKVVFSLSKDNLLQIKITSKDFTAFRAMESAVMRLLVTYYKVEKLENGN